MAVPVQTPSPVAATYPVIKSPLESLAREASKDDTIASNVSPIPDDDVAVVSPIPLDVEEFKPTAVAVDFGTQTGRSLMVSPEKSIQEIQTQPLVEKPSTIAIQTDNGDWTPVDILKGNIKVLQTIVGNEETIEIATKSNLESRPRFDNLSKLGDDLTVDLKYKDSKDGLEQGETISELNISHFEPQSFETIVLDPGESSTEVIVDADGTKRIIVRKTKKTISHHQRILQTQPGLIPVDIKPAVFSEVTLQQQQKSVTHLLPDGKTEVTTSQGYIGQIVRGAEGGEITSSEFSNMPGQDIAVCKTFPAVNINLQNLTETLPATELGTIESEGSTEWAASSSTVRAAVHQIRKKVVRITKKVVRKIVIVDGKEHITEEIVEEPEEVEVTEENIPRVTIEISRNGQGGIIVQEPFEEPEYSLQDQGVEISEITSDEYPENKSEEIFDVPAVVGEHNENQVQNILQKDLLALDNKLEVMIDEAKCDSKLEEKPKGISTLELKVKRDKSELKGKIDDAIPSLRKKPSKQKKGETEKPQKEPLHELLEAKPAKKKEATKLNSNNKTKSPIPLSPEDEPSALELDISSKDTSILVGKIDSEKKSKSDDSNSCSVTVQKKEKGQRKKSKTSSLDDSTKQTAKEEIPILTKPTAEENILSKNSDDVISLPQVQETILESTHKVKTPDKTSSSSTENERSTKKKSEKKEKKEKSKKLGNKEIKALEVSAIQKSIEEECFYEPPIKNENKIEIVSKTSVETETVSESNKNERNLVPSPVVEDAIPPKDESQLKLSLEEELDKNKTNVLSEPNKIDNKSNTVSNENPIQRHATVKNIEVEISVTNPIEPHKDVPIVSSDTKVEAMFSKDFPADTMEIVKQRSVVVLPAVEVVKEVKKSRKKSSVHILPDNLKGETIIKDSAAPADEVSVSSSLAESMEIDMPESPNSSDSIKPTQEIFQVSSPTSDLSQCADSIKTFDTGYEGEDKTTVDETSSIEIDINKSKKKKKKRQKIKEVGGEGGSSIEPKSSDFVPSEEIEENVQDIPTVEKKSKKTKKATKSALEKMYSAETKDENVEEESFHDISEKSLSEGVVKIVEESMPARSSSEAEEFKSTNVLTSVPVLEVLPTQSESVQTATPEPEVVKLVDTFDTSAQAVQETQESFAQTLSPNSFSTEVCIQTVPKDLVPTIEYASQTDVFKVESPVEIVESTMQTDEEERPCNQEEEVQTDEVKFGSMDNVDSGIQTVTEEQPTYHEETVQTSPEPEKVQTASQVISEDLIPTEEEESQTTEQIITTADLSTQIKTSELIPIKDEYVQTTPEEKKEEIRVVTPPAVVELVEKASSPIIELADKKDEKHPQFEKPHDTSSSDKSEVPQNVDQSDSSSESKSDMNPTLQANSKLHQTEFKSNESQLSSELPFKIEIEATLSYDADTDTEPLTSETSKSEDKPPDIQTSSSETTDTDVSSWKSHKAESRKPQTNKKAKTRDSNVVSLKSPSKETSILKSTDKNVVKIKQPDVKAKVNFEIDEYDSSLKPELSAELSREKNISALFIQAELKPSPSIEETQGKRTVGISQTLELEMTSKPDKEISQTSSKKSASKKSRKIRQRADTKSFQEPTTGFSHEELRGEHSPGPPEREKERDLDFDEKQTLISTPVKVKSPKGLSFQGTLSTPFNSQDISVASSTDKMDIQLTLEEKPEKLSLDTRDPSDNYSLVSRTLRLDSSHKTIPIDNKIEQQMFIDSETSDGTLSDKKSLETDKPKKKKKGKQQNIDNQIISNDKLEDSDSSLQKPSNKSLIDPLPVKDVSKETQDCLKIKWIEVGNLVSGRLKPAESQPSTYVLYLTSAEPNKVTHDDQNQQLHVNLQDLQDAVKNQDVPMIQETLIITVEFISTWLETIQWKIHHTKVSSFSYFNSRTKKNIEKKLNAK